MLDAQFLAQTSQQAAIRSLVSINNEYNIQSFSTEFIATQVYGQIVHAGKQRGDSALPAWGRPCTQALCTFWIPNSLTLLLLLLLLNCLVCLSLQVISQSLPYR